ncbi:hypothetical protein EJ04DRAFT_500127 [Polyplosphaeria fusca]|uniref:Zn(2)-C6 fungal-type domain-containing protein n=1 Tax=Polyplosphaeria fusca TaxID=682080 RepID=A0A9P4QTE6_9PLEO|nr:hypothetical protein EJ04DRAFT_500127 [Polyplosphaeria fusca]
MVVTPPTPAPAQAQRRVRVALACQRCKGRKQRCDGGHPSCKSCSKVGIDCVYEPTLRPRYPGGKMLYINALEERIAFLEAQLPEYGQDHFGQVEPQKGSRPLYRLRVDAGSVPDQQPDKQDSLLVDGVAYLSLCASGTTDATIEPFYMGSSSGATIARMIQAQVFSAQKSSPTLTPLDTLRSRSNSSATSPTSPLQPTLCQFPPPVAARQLFSTFLNRLHTRWPILDRKLYERIYERQYDQAALSILERSNLHMIYAISARFLQLTKQATDVDPEVHFAAAIEPMNMIMENHNSSTVQFLTLLAIYGQRSPYGAGVWSQVRFSITLCVELGMHRKPTKNSPSWNPRDLELRRRIFWSCYCLDRLTSVLLGRTFAISDRDINVELPSEDPAFWDLTSSQPPATDEATWSNILPFIHIIKLRQLQSRTQRIVFRVDVDHASRTPEVQAREDAKVAKIRIELDEWVNNIPEPPPNSRGNPNWMYQPEPSNSHLDSRYFFTLQYRKTILSLYTTLLPSLPVSDHRFISCAQSSALICTTYKRLHQQKTLSFTIIALHSCFVAGLTLVYCLWRDKTLFNFDILEATRSCSQCLAIFGEKWPGAIKYGEIFEALSGSVLRAIMEPAQQDGQNVRINLDMLAEPSAPNNDIGKSSGPLLGAVKEVFMEVDEDVPGGWQGWRMFNEMVQSDIQEPSLGTGGMLEVGSQAGGEDSNTAWNESEILNAGLEGSGMGVAFGNQGGWDHGFFAGYE